MRCWEVQWEAEPTRGYLLPQQEGVFDGSWAQKGMASVPETFPAFPDKEHPC